MTTPAAPLPAYALYGERAGVLADRLHCESIAERSQRHDWEIRPHRHESLFQILHIQRGHVQAALDGRSLSLVGPCVVTVPALAAHGFVFSPDVDGHVFTVAEPHLAALVGSEPALRETLSRLQGWTLARGDAAARPVQAAVLMLRDEFRGHAAWRSLAVDAALLRLLVALARSAPAVAVAGEPTSARALLHVHRLRAEVEARFREQPGMAELAEAIGITPTQLNRVCRRVLGHSALGVLHARLLLEAQRDLAYTTLSVKQVALGLGFSDAGYFTRFFQRATGRTPTAWRGDALR